MKSNHTTLIYRVDLGHIICIPLLVVSKLNFFRRYLIEVIEVLGKQIEQTNTGGENAQLSLHVRRTKYHHRLTLYS